MAAHPAIAHEPRSLSAALCLAILCLLSVRSARSDESPADYLRDTYTALLVAGDADSLAAASELASEPSVRPEQRLGLVASATALAPQRVDLAWLRLEACAHVASCDPRPLAATIHALDGENGAAWAPLLAAATQRGDAALAAAYLADIARAGRFDLYWNARIAHLGQAVIRTHTVDARTAVAAVVGAEAALAIPALQILAHACQAKALTDPHRLALCRQMAVSMQAGDTHIIQLFGTSMARRVWPEGSGEYVDATARRRLLQYRASVAQEITGGGFASEADALQLLGLMSTHRCEPDVTVAIIEGAGRSATPPADWSEPQSGS
jgi:hypothetical protein